MPKLEAEMPASLMHEWMEYEEIEPFGAWRDNFHAAMIAAILANANRDPKKQPTAYKVSEFFYVDPESAADREEMQFLNALRSVAKPATDVVVNGEGEYAVPDPPAADLKVANGHG